MEAAAPSAPKTGWLIKQSRPSTIRKTWNRRFFVLEWPTLRYYKEEADAAAAGREPKGVLQCDGVTLTDDFPHASERPHVFGVFHQSREPFFLQAATTEEMIGWVNAIRNDDAKVGLIDFDEVKMLGEGAYGSVKLVRHRAKRTLHAMKVRCISRPPVVAGPIGLTRGAETSWSDWWQRLTRTTTAASATRSWTAGWPSEPDRVKHVVLLVASLATLPQIATPCMTRHLPVL